MCCVCHTGGGDDEYDYMAQQAIEMNTRFQKGLPLEDEVPLKLDLDEEQWGGKIEFTDDEVWEDIVTLPSGLRIKRRLDIEWIKRFEQ